MKSVEGQRGSRAGVGRHLLKGLLPGICLIVLGLALLFVVPFLLAVEQRTSVLFYSGLVVLSLGVVVFAVLGYVTQTRYLERRFVFPPGVVEALREIGPDREFETREFLVFRKKDVSVLLPKVLFIGAYFVRLFSQARVSGSHKVKLPFRSVTGTIRRGRFQDEVNGLSIAKSWGDFVVPTDAVRLSEKGFQESYGRGPGIIYFVFRYDLKGVTARYPGGYIGIDRLLAREHYQPSFDLSEKFDKATISKIMEKISNEKVKT